MITQTSSGPGLINGFGTPAYRTYVIATLTFAYTLNFIDRILIGVVAQPIIEEFALRDWQFGLLSGFGFAVMYTLAGIPIARLAERTNRVRIIAFSVILWSAMTALCGVAGSFLALLVFRVGVGIGEAGCTPAAHSLIVNYFPASARARAFAIYATGVTIGSILANLFGGPIAHAFTWRQAFIILGIPGVLAGLVMLLTLKEPPRPQPDVGEAVPARENIFAALGRISSSAYWQNTAAATLASFFGYALSNFQAPFFQRVHGLTVAEVATRVSIPLGVVAALGTLTAGLAIERFSDRLPRIVAQLPGVALILAGPFYFVGFSADNAAVAMGSMLIASFLFHSYFGASFTICQTVVGDHSRATAVAVMLFVVNLFGYGLGPLTIGLLSDNFAQLNLAEHLGTVIADTASCKRSILPGTTALTEFDLACRDSFAAGLQRALQIGTVFIFLAGSMFLVCSRSLPRLQMTRP